MWTNPGAPGAAFGSAPSSAGHCASSVCSSPLRASECHVGREPADEQQKVSAAVLLALRWIECQRQPDLHILIVHVESGRHDADHRRFHAVDVDLLADDIALAGEGALPQLGRQDGDRRRVRQRLLRREGAAESRRDAERVKETRRGNARGDARRRLSFRADVHRTGDVRTDIREGAIALAELEILGGVDRELIEAERRELARDVDQLVWSAGMAAARAARR